MTQIDPRAAFEASMEDEIKINPNSTKPTLKQIIIDNIALIDKFRKSDRVQMELIAENLSKAYKRTINVGSFRTIVSVVRGEAEAADPASVMPNKTRRGDNTQTVKSNSTAESGITAMLPAQSPTTQQIQSDPQQIDCPRNATAIEPDDPDI